MCLKYGRQRLSQACFALEQALALGEKNNTMLEELGDMLEQQGLHNEAVRVFTLTQQLINDKILAENNGFSPDEVSDSEDQSVIDLKRSRGLVLSKLGKIYCNDSYSDSDIEQAISTFKVAIKMVHGVNNK